LDDAKYRLKNFMLSDTAHRFSLGVSHKKILISIWLVALFIAALIAAVFFALGKPALIASVGLGFGVLLTVTYWLTVRFESTWQLLLALLVVSGISHVCLVLIENLFSLDFYVLDALAASLAMITVIPVFSVAVVLCLFLLVAIVTGTFYVLEWLARRISESSKGSILATSAFAAAVVAVFKAFG